MSETQGMGQTVACVDDVLITPELERRPRREPDYAAESRSLTALAQEMASHPEAVLHKVATLAMEMCRADSAGVSVLEPGGEHGILRWHAATGAAAPHLNGTIPREASPCGTVMSRNELLLFQEAERFFPACRSVEPRMYESLLAPWTADGEASGTVWVIHHTPEGRFDAEDARLLTSLARFASAAYGTVAALHLAQDSQRELERKVDERTRELRESEARLAADLAGMRRLYDLHARLATETHLKTALNEILVAACEFTGTDRGCVQLVSDDGHRLEMYAWRGYTDNSPFVEHFRYEGFQQGCDVARVERKRLLIEDTVGYPGLEGTAAGAAVLADGIRAAQSTPLVSRRGQTVGVLSTQFGQPHRPTGEELRLMDLLAWTAADFVERHRAEKALQQSRDLFQATLDSSPDMIQVFEAVRDAQGEIIDFRWVLNNHTSESRYGDICGQSLLQRNPGVVEDGILADFKRVTETGQPVQVERYYAHDQVDSWFFQSAVKLGDGVATTTKDITAWKEAQREVLRLRDEVAEARLRDSEQNLHGVANVVPDLLWHGKPDGSAAWYNDRWLAYTGQTLAQATNWGWIDVIHPDDRDASESGYRQAVEHGKAWQQEHRIRRHDGKYRWFLARSEPLQDEQGRVLRTYGAATDIHDQRLALEALRQSEQRLQRALAIETVGVLFFRLDGRIHDANEAFLRMCGYTRDELRTLDNWATLTMPEYLQATRRAAAELAGTGETAPYEKKMIRADGSPWWGLFAPTRLSGSGTESECVEFVVDITERKQAEAALRESEEQFRRALEKAPIPVIMHAEDGQVLQISSTWTELTGYGPEDLPTFEAWLNHAYGEGSEAVRRHMHELFEGKQPSLNIEFPIRTRTGDQRYWSFSASSPGTLRDGRRFIVGMAVDITERQRAEERQRLLMGELNHRVKNTLATLQSIANQTLLNSGSPEEFVSHFEGRIFALSSAHDLLTRMSWEAAAVADILREQLVLDGDRERILLDGPPAALTAQASLALALVVHELGTNARKYGALSVPCGCVHIRWSITTDGDNPTLRLDWHEQEGPPVRKPERQGFGTALIAHSLAGVGGRTELRFEPGGLCCLIHLPLAVKATEQRKQETPSR